MLLCEQGDVRVGRVGELDVGDVDSDDLVFIEVDRDRRDGASLGFVGVAAVVRVGEGRGVEGINPRDDDSVTFAASLRREATGKGAERSQTRSERVEDFLSV